MSGTPDVLRLSGWLNADASCRVTQRHMEGDTGGWEARGRVGRCRSTQRARRARLDTEGMACARGRTLNIQAISVTLDVSRLSGWLNAEAPCRVTRRHMEGDTPGEGREGVVGGSGERSGHGGSLGHGTRGEHT